MRNWIGFSIRIVFILCGLVVFFYTGNDTFHSYIDGNGEKQVLMLTNLEHLPAAIISAAIFLISFLALAVLYKTQIRKASFIESLQSLSWHLFPYSFLLVGLLRYGENTYSYSEIIFLLSTSLLLPLFVVLTVIVIVSLIPFSVEREVGDRDDRIPWRTALATTIVFFGVGTAILIPFMERELFSGDQPHYLLVTHSILEDGDIAFDDEYADEVYLQWDEIPELDPQSMVPDRNGRAVPFHRIGLSLMAVPFYAIAGKEGAVFMVLTMGALAAGLLFLIFHYFLGTTSLSLPAVLWTLCTMPLVQFHFLFMNEIPLICVVSIVVFLLLYFEMNPGLMVLHTLLIWWLPWMHTRGFFVAIFLGLAMIWKLRNRRILLTTFILVSIVLGLSTPWWNYLVYGDFSLVAQLPDDFRSELNPINAFRNALGILFDGHFGIIIHNPAFLFALAGIGTLWLKQRKLFYLLIGWLVFALAPTLMHDHWWGGISPARYLALSMPAAALSLSFLYKHAGLTLRRIVIVTIVLSLIVGWFGIYEPILVTNHRSEAPALLGSVAIGEATAARLWPSWFNSTSFFLHIVLLAVTLAAVASLFLLKKRTGKLFSVVFFIGILVVAGIYGLLSYAVNPGAEADSFAWRTEHDNELVQAVRHGNAKIIDYRGLFSPSSLPTYGYSAIKLFGRSPLVADPEAPRGRYYPIRQNDNKVTLSESRTPFWAGKYELRLAVAAGEGETASIKIYDISDRGVSNSEPILSQQVASGTKYDEKIFAFDLPDNSWGLEIAFDGTDSLRFAYAVIAPLSLTQLTDWKGPVPAFDMAVLRYNEFKLFMEPEHVYLPDSRWFWIRGDARANFWIATGRPVPGIKLNQRSGDSVVSLVRWRKGEKVVEFPKESKMIRHELPVRGTTAVRTFWMPFRIEITGQFKPNDKDTRILGAHTQVALQQSR